MIILSSTRISSSSFPVHVIAYFKCLIFHYMWFFVRSEEHTHWENIPNDPTKLCPGHHGGSACNNGGLRQPRNNASARPYCPHHLSIVATETRLLKRIKVFREQSGVDLQNSEKQPKPPNPRKILNRPAGSRTQSAEHKDLMKRLENLEHKVWDARQLWLQEKAVKEKYRTKLKRLSTDMDSELDNRVAEEKLAFDEEIKQLRTELDVEKANGQRKDVLIQRHQAAVQSARSKTSHARDATNRAIQLASTKEKQLTKLHHKLDSRQRQFSSELDTERAKALRKDMIIQRHQASVEAARSKAADARAKMNSAIQESVTIENQLSETQVELAHAQKPNRRRVPKDPEAAARFRAKDLVSDWIEPRQWDREESKWVLAKAAMDLKIDGAEMAQCMGRQRAVKLDKTTSGNVRRQVAKISSLMEKADEGALGVYLSSIETKVLAEHVPADVRRLLITQWVEKVQEFWSRERCALLKSITMTSNAAWAWFRSLLGLELVDSEGGKRWLAKTIDGNV